MEVIVVGREIKHMVSFKTRSEASLLNLMSDQC